jgi:hypothetical protein
MKENRLLKDALNQLSASFDTFSNSIAAKLHSLSAYPARLFNL